MRGLRAAVATALAMALVGAASGVATLAVHTRGWGLPLAAAAALAALLAAPPRWWSRLPLALGWVLPIGLALAGRPEGDYVVSREASGQALVLLAVVVLVTGLASVAASSVHVRSGT